MENGNIEPASAADCTKCEYRKAMANPHAGVRIPSQHGKCTRPGGLCALVSQTIEVAQMTDDERDRLKELETVIDENMVAGLQLCLAAHEIRERKLFRETHDVFEEYMKDRFGLARRTAFQYAKSGRTYALVRNCALVETMPTNECQIRPLSKLSDEAAPVGWKKAVETVPDGTPTGAHVSRIVAEMLGSQVRRRAQGEKSKVDQSNAIPEPLKNLVFQLIEQVQNVRLKQSGQTLRKELKRRLEGILRILED
jgi:hypothetical protein